ncbi:MAG: hypothetical protein L6416_05975 [Candidatus Omnitrophica bacterium]|nr:hypothetical protein [Candidatus Omnitrophota bacterium]
MNIGNSNNRIKLCFLENKSKFLKLFFLIPLGVTITAIAYFLLTQIFYYFPGGVGGKEVFLTPRYLLQQNDLPSGIFQQWRQLILVIFTGVAFIFTALNLSRNKKITFGKFLFFIYILAISLEFMFVLLTPNGWGHLALQAKSINNGIWLSLQVINETIHLRHLDFVDTMRYIYIDLGGNTCGYTLPGTTHPPGIFLVSIAIFTLATHIFRFLHNPALAWAITMTLTNTLLIVIVSLIAREAFSTRIAKLTAISLLTVPSVLMHFCALLDAIASLFTATGILIMLNALKYFRLDTFSRNRTKSLLMGMFSGLFFMLCIQMTYGHIVPISALILTFIVLVDKKDFKNLSMFMLGMSMLALMYFSFEYWISNGTSFWFKRAFRLAKIVGDGLAWRPYPLSQVANFVILSVMGGILFLPCIIFMSGYTFSSLWRLIRGRLYISNTRALCRFSLSFSVILILSYLIFQKTVRLEVERTLHWFFVFIWSMSGIFLVAIDVFCREIFPGMFIRNRNWGLFIFLLLQFVITLTLAMGIQDYY